MNKLLVLITKAGKSDRFCVTFPLHKYPAPNYFLTYAEADDYRLFWVQFYALVEPYEKIYPKTT